MGSDDALSVTRRSVMQLTGAVFAAPSAPFASINLENRRMAFTPNFVDLVRNTTTTTGTGDFVLGPAANGFTGFAQALQAGDSFYYSCIGVDKPAEREVGRGTLLAGGQVSRDPISGVKTNFTTGTKTIALIAAAEWFTNLQSGAGAAAPSFAADRAGLASSAAQNAPAILSEPGREGLFEFRVGNLSAKVAADPRQALTIAPASDASGASGAWERITAGHINVRWFGAAGDGASDDTAAIQAALNYANFLGGATIYFPEGTFRVTSYLTIYKKTVVRGAGRKASVITTAAAGGGGASTDQNVRNGSVFYSNWPSNASTAVDIVIEHLGISCTNGSNVGAAIYDNGGSYLNLNNLTLTGFKYGVIFDQSELCDIDLVDFEGQSLAGLWIANGPDLKIGNGGFYANRLAAKRCQFDEAPTAYGILDDGGNNHVFEDNNYNGCLNHIRAAAVAQLVIRGGEFEGAAQHNVVATNLTLAGSGAGGVTGGLIDGGTYTAQTGYACLHNISGSWLVTGNALFSTSGSPAIVGCVNMANLHIGAACQMAPGEKLVDGYGTNTYSYQLRAGAPPTSGYHFAGELVYNNAPTAGGVIGWRCVAAGSPGTWEALYPWTNVTSGADVTFDTSGTHFVKVGDAANGYFYLRSGTNGEPEVHIRPAAGRKGVFSFTEDAVADRWSCGIKPADGNFYFSQGDSVLGNVKFTFTAAGDLAASGAITGSNLSGTNTGDQFTNTTASRLIGRGSTSGAGAAQEIGLAGGLTISGTNLGLGAITPTSIVSPGAVTSSGGGVGYATGAGGTVTQLTSKSTSVTLNKLSGQVTTSNASLAAAAVVSFVVSNSQVVATDTINLNLASGNATPGTYRYWVEGVAAGSFKIVVENRSAGALAEALAFNFAVLKAVNA